MTDYMSPPAVDSCLILHALESTFNEGGQTVGRSLRDNDLMIQCCVGQYSYCVAANTRSLKLAERFLTIHSAFLNY